MFNDEEYCRWTYYIVGMKDNILIDVCAYKKINSSILSVIYKGEKFQLNGTYKDVSFKKGILLFKDNKISLDDIHIKFDKININAIIRYKKIKFGTLEKIGGCDGYIYSYGTITEGSANNNEIKEYKTFFIETRGKKTPKSYYYVAGCYKDFEGGYFLRLTGFNYNKVSCMIYNIYHGNVSKTKGNSKFKIENNKLDLKFGDYKNSIKVQITFGKRIILEDLGDSIDKIFKDIYRESISYVEIQDDNLTKVFVGNSENTIIDKRQYL